MIDEQEEEVQTPQQEGPRAIDLALSRLCVREYGAIEMRDYLVKKGVADKAEADEVVRELVESGRIDDERYARVLARHHAFRGKGPTYVMAKLRQKGVNLPRGRVEALYREVIPENAESEADLARKLVERKFPQAGKDRKVRERAYRALVGRGFSRDAIASCFRSLAE